MDGKTPGQAAYEAFSAAVLTPEALANDTPFGRLGEDHAVAWEAAAQAAIAAVLPPLPAKWAQSAPDHSAHTASLEKDLDDAGATIADYRDALCAMQAERDQLHARLAEHATEIMRLRDRLGCAEEQAAGYACAIDAYRDEVTRITRERDGLRKLVREILAEIELGTLGQHTPRATARTLARTAEWRKRAGLLREAVPAEPQPAPDPAGHAVYHAPLCRCGHKQTVHAGTDATGRCVLRSCGCGRFEAAPVRNPKRTGIEG